MADLAEGEMRNFSHPAARQEAQLEAATRIPTRFGEMLVKVYRNEQGAESLAIIAGALVPQSAVSVRVHSACMTAEVLGSLKCDCKSQLDYALQYIADQDGIVIYLPQEGRGIGLVNKIRAYALQEEGLDTVDANRALGLPDDARDYSDAVSILHNLGVRCVRLLTNNPLKVSELRNMGIDVSERVPMPLMANKHSFSYLQAKRSRMGHLFDLDHEVSCDLANDMCSNTKAVSGAQRPIIHVNFALDQHGRTAKESGESLALSCDRDWRRVHELREYYSAVVVGARTWLMDQPCLTARKTYLGREPRRQPERVIFAGSNKCEFQPEQRRTFIIGSGESSQGAIFIKSEGHGLEAPLKTLQKYGVQSMLVEGGLTLLHSFLREGMVDQLTIYIRTHSRKKAAAAIQAALPGLPLQSLQMEPFGEGILATGDRGSFA